METIMRNVRLLTFALNNWDRSREYHLQLGVSAIFIHLINHSLKHVVWWLTFDHISMIPLHMTQMDLICNYLTTLFTILRSYESPIGCLHYIWASFPVSAHEWSRWMAHQVSGISAISFFILYMKRLIWARFWVSSTSLKLMGTEGAQHIAG